MLSRKFEVMDHTILIHIFGHGPLSTILFTCFNLLPRYENNKGDIYPDYDIICKHPNSSINVYMLSKVTIQHRLTIGGSLALAGRSSQDFNRVGVGTGYELILKKKKKKSY
jgi:hypothetical protein